MARHGHDLSTSSFPWSAKGQFSQQTYFSMNLSSEVLKSCETMALIGAKTAITCNLHVIHCSLEIEMKALREKTEINTDSFKLWAASTWCAPRTMERSPSPSCKHGMDAMVSKLQYVIHKCHRNFKGKANDSHISRYVSVLEWDEDRWNAEKSTSSPCWCSWLGHPNPGSRPSLHGPLLIQSMCLS